MDKDFRNYRMVCTLTFGDIYGQIIVWLIVIFLTLASTLALWSSTRQIFALATVGLVVVLSLPFLLFAFVTTLFYRFSGGQLPNFQGKSPGIFPPITPMVGTF